MDCEAEQSTGDWAKRTIVEHTQGPWTWARSYIPARAEHVCILSSSVKTIALHVAAWPVEEADGHLIAASPTLYEFARSEAATGNETAKTMLALLQLPE